MSDAKHAIETIAAALAETRASAEAGAAIDLRGLEAAAVEALRQAEHAPASQRPALLLALTSLAVELDQLAGTIERQHRSEAQRRAAAAYGDAAQRSGGDR